MDYGTFERILADLHGVTLTGRKAFRSRLRVLRDAGVPAVVKPGKGSKVDYRFQDLWEAHLALNLERFGLPPLRVQLFTKAAEDWIELLRLWRATTSEDIWAYMMFFEPRKPASLEGRRMTRIGNWVGLPPVDSYTRINVPEYRQKGLQLRISTLDTCVKFLKNTEIERHPAAVYALINISEIDRECMMAVQTHL
jgi:hypothetical protein